MAEEQKASLGEVMQRVVSHFDQLERCSLAVPEWGEGDGNPLIIYWSRWTVGEWQKVNAKSQMVSGMGGTIDVIIQKAEDADGKKLFTIADKPLLLRRASASVIERIAKIIALDVEIRVEDAAKK